MHLHTALILTALYVLAAIAGSAGYPYDVTLPWWVHAWLAGGMLVNVWSGPHDCPPDRCRITVGEWMFGTIAVFLLWPVMLIMAVWDA